MNEQRKIDQFKTVIKQRIDGYLNDRFGLKRKDARTVHVGGAFTEFCVRDIVAPLNPMSEDDIQAGLRCDGKNDLGIDFIVQQDETYHIYQMKYNHLAFDDVAGFFQIDDRIFSGDLSRANDEVQDLLAKIHRGSLIRYYLMSSVTASKDMRIDFNRQMRAAELDGGRKNVKWDLKHLPTLCAEYLSGRILGGKPPRKVNIPLEWHLDQHGREGIGHLDLSETLAAKEGCYESKVIAIKGTTLKHLYRENGRSLFHENIRGYLGGKMSINRAITQTLKEQPEFFYLFNNGMSALCRGWKMESGGHSEGDLVCKQFQIINGAQTACSIGEFQDDGKLDKVRVLLRITNTEHISDKEGNLKEDIIRFNNRQNVIRDSDFHSNDPIQKFLAREFRGKQYKVGRLIRDVFYQPKRGVELPKGRRGSKPVIIGLETLAKALYAYSDKNEPSKLYSASKFLFEIDKEVEGVYRDKYMFGGEHDGEEVPFFAPDRMQKIIAIAFLQFWLEEKLRENRRPLERDDKRDEILYMSYCVRWHFLWAFGHVIRHFYQSRENEIYRKIIDGDGLAEDGLVPRWFKGIAKLVQNLLADEQSDDGALNFKIWQRSAKKVEKLKGRIEREEIDSFPF